MECLSVLLFALALPTVVTLQFQNILGSLQQYGQYTGYTGNSFLGGIGGIKNNILPHATALTKEDGDLKLVGRQVFSEYDGPLPQAHGIAATISQSSKLLGGSVFDDSYYGYSGGLGGQGLSMNIQVQTSQPGYYHVVLTSLASTQNGCKKETLGSVLDYSHQLNYNPLGLFAGRSSSYSELPDGVIADVELGRNIPKSIHLARLKMFTHLKDLAGRGVALCEASSKTSKQRPCSGRIVACVGVHYSSEPIELGYVELPSPDMMNRVGRDHGKNPAAPPTVSNIVPLTSPNQPNIQPNDIYNFPEPDVYFDMDKQPYYDEDNEMLDTYSPPPLPRTPDYDPFGASKYYPEPSKEAVLHGEFLGVPSNYPNRITDYEFGLPKYG